MDYWGVGKKDKEPGVAALERAELVGEWDPVTCAYWKYAELRLRYLERMPLGTTYPSVAERVVKITQSAEMAGRCSLVVDATGVGRPVVDLLRRERPGCTLMPVTITGGASESRGGGYYGVPKRDLVTGMQVLLQGGGLQIASGIPHGAALAAEMAEMRVKLTASGNTQFGAWREGTHDDLVLAVALACWGGPEAVPERSVWGGVLLAADGPGGMGERDQEVG